MPPETPEHIAPEIRSQARAARSSFVRWFLILTGVGLVIAAYPLIVADSMARYSALAGFAIGVVMCFPSSWFTFGLLGGDTNRLTLVAFGFMMVRMVVVVGTLYFAATLPFVHVIAYIAALMGTYVVYQALEIVILKLNFS